MGTRDDSSKESGYLAPAKAEDHESNVSGMTGGASRRRAGNAAGLDPALFGHGDGWNIQKMARMRAEGKKVLGNTKFDDNGNLIKGWEGEKLGDEGGDGIRGCLQQEAWAGRIS